MDTELATHLMDIKEGMGRIDERTVAIHDNQKRLSKAFVGHEAQDHQDFKEVHSRITMVEKKQNWTLGVGSAIVFLITVGVAVFSGVPDQKTEPTAVTLELEKFHSEVTLDDMGEDYGD